MVSEGLVLPDRADIFSALDTLTSRFIIENLFRGDLVQGRTILLIVSFLSSRSY